MKVAIITFGCKVNQYESEYMAERLEEAGHVVVSPQADADVYIINSCAVTHTAERKVQNRIRRIKRENPSAKVIVVGCYPQLKPDDPLLHGADLVLGNKEKKEIEKFLKFDGVRFIVDKAYWLRDGKIESVRAGYGDMVRAYVKIEDGCDRSCTYCAIRLARGTKIRSKPISLVLSEIKNLIESGYGEIILAGINLGRFGVDTGERLYDLLAKLERMEGDFRVRLSSLNPEDVDEDIFKAFAEFEKLSHHLHISLQSGSDRILKRMGRQYKKEDFLRIVDRLRDIDPLFSITTDVIVGFPGETERDFKESLDVIEKVVFSKVHAFRFSPREGTPAAKMPNQIPGNVKRDRITMLEEVAREVGKEYRRWLVGKRLKVLVERIKEGISLGRDEYYVLHEFIGGRTGRFLEVEVLSVSEEGVISKSAHQLHREAI